MNFNIIKKNRKYFAAEKNGYKCKILIDTNSEALELGEHILDVEDISVRSKYGTDLIFKLSASVDDQKTAGICSLKTTVYNSNLVDECRKLGGKWDGAESAWIFSGLVSNEVESLDEKYNSELIGIEIEFVNEVSEYNNSVYLGGFKIATAWGRDSGAKPSGRVSIIAGWVGSGGSLKNWKTVIKAGTIIRMEIPALCYDDIICDDIDIKRL